MESKPAKPVFAIWLTDRGTGRSAYLREHTKDRAVKTVNPGRAKARADSINTEFAEFNITAEVCEYKPGRKSINE